MPTFWENRNLVYFAAFKSHIGFYPGPSGVATFEEELKAYKHAKESIQFPLSNPIPYHLIREIVRMRVKKNKSQD